MEVTIELPDNLANSLKSNEKDLPQIIETGLREFRAVSSIGYKSIAEVLEFLAGLPSPKEILELRPSSDLQNKIEELLEKNRRDGLSEEEENLWASYEYIEHLIRVAKAKALKKLNK